MTYKPEVESRIRSIIEKLINHNGDIMQCYADVVSGFALIWMNWREGVDVSETLIALITNGDRRVKCLAMLCLSQMKENSDLNGWGIERAINIVDSVDDGDPVVNTTKGVCNAELGSAHAILWIEGEMRRKNISPRSEFVKTWMWRVGTEIARGWK